MRRIAHSIAAASAALVSASPAAAQYYPAPRPAPYGNGGYGFRGNWGEARALHERIESIERQIGRLDRRDRIGDDRADRLRDEANRIERQLRYASRDGLNPYEAREIRFRVDRLEQQVRYAAAYGYSRYGDLDDRWHRDRDEN